MSSQTWQSKVLFTVHNNTDQIHMATFQRVGEPDYWQGYPQSKAPAGSSQPLLTTYRSFPPCTLTDTWSEVLFIVHYYRLLLTSYFLIFTSISELGNLTTGKAIPNLRHQLAPHHPYYLPFFSCTVVTDTWSEGTIYCSQ